MGVTHVISLCHTTQLAEHTNFCPQTIRISTMHILRMIVAKAEETHGLRINFVLCISILIFYNKLKIFRFHWK